MKLSYGQLRLLVNEALSSQAGIAPVTRSVRDAVSSDPYKASRAILMSVAQGFDELAENDADGAYAEAAIKIRNLASNLGIDQVPRSKRN